MWAKKNFPDGSLIKKLTSESWLYVEPTGHTVEVIVDYAGKGVYPKNVIYPRTISVWNSPANEPITEEKRAEILSKLEHYFGRGNIRFDWSWPAG